MYTIVQNGRVTIYIQTYNMCTYIFISYQINDILCVFTVILCGDIIHYFVPAHINFYFTTQQLILCSIFFLQLQLCCEYYTFRILLEGGSIYR